MSFENDLTDSSKAFLQLVWPVMKSRLGGGDVIPVESVTDRSMAQMLDQYSGIDAWHVTGNKQMRGISSRVQFGPKNWDSFTVRYARDSGAATEYEKRKRDIESAGGYLYPQITVQAYVSDRKEGELLSIGIIKTASLIDACTQIIAGGINGSDGGIRRTGNASFIWCNWTWLQSRGYAIKVVSKLKEAA